MKVNTSYRGVVKVQKYKNNELISVSETHNRGTWHLFNTICRMLAGNSVTTLIPRYIDVLTSSGQSVLREKVSWTDVTFATRPETGADGDFGDDEDECSIVYNFSIYGDNRASTGGTRLALVNDNDAISAWTELSLTERESSTFDLSLDEMLIITWTMTFKNGE